MPLLLECRAGDRPGRSAREDTITATDPSESGACLAPGQLRAPRLPALGAMAPARAWALAGAIAAPMAAHVAMREGTPANVAFTLAVIGAAAAVVALVAGRALLAAFVVTAAVALLYEIAHLKRQATDVTLHAYDAVSHLTSWSALSGLLYGHPASLAALLGAIAAAAALAAVIHRSDGSRVDRRYALGAAALCAVLAFLTADPREARRHMGFYYEDRPLWFFFSSWAETAEALWRGHLLDAVAREGGPSLTVPAHCVPSGRPPHIVLIHQESVVPPSHFPSLRYDRSLDRFFRSFDGRIHKLRVETYGGASWLTEYSVLTGLSAFSLGHLRQFAQTIMAGKVRETLPQVLARCGYRNLAFHPMLRIYLSIGNFLAAVGMHRTFDAKDQGAPSAMERDHFYYASALTEMERHLASSTQPLFTFIETMATHGPYGFTYMPEVEVPGGEAGTDPYMHEYLRRVAMSRIDYDRFRAELARRFPGQPFLIVRYGDHQPTATLALLGYGEEADIEHVLRSGNPAALITFYAVDALNFEPAPLPEAEILDVPYLPGTILAAARLPLPDTYRERLRLAGQCEGRYHGCPAVARFHRRLIDSGIVDAW